VLFSTVWLLENASFLAAPVLKQPISPLPLVQVFIAQSPAAFRAFRALDRPNANEASPLLDRLANTEMIVEVEQSQNRLFSTFNAELLPAILWHH
jgi:hypothetical protein